MIKKMQVLSIIVIQAIFLPDFIVVAAPNPVRINENVIWSDEVIDTGIEGKVIHSSLEVDSNDITHISYHDSINSNLNYAVHTGSGWNIQVAASGVPDLSIIWNSLALSSDNIPHIAIGWLIDGDSGFLKYTYWDGSTWQLEQVDQGAGGQPCLVLDTNDFPHITYNRLSGWAKVKYAFWNGSTWSIDILDSSIRSHGSSIQINGSGYPCVSFHDDSNDCLKYAEWNGIEWHFTILATDILGGGSFNPLALNSSSEPHISFMNNWNLCFTWRSDHWVSKTIDSGYLCGVEQAIEIDENDKIHIAYLDRDNENLKYAYSDGTGWFRETVASEGSVGWYPSISVDSEGCAHISYFDNSNNTLRYAKRQSEPVIPTPLPSDADHFEPDDDCSLAQEISSDNPLQFHNFHQPSDIDWVYMNLAFGEELTIYTRELTGWLSPKLSIYDECNGSVIASGDRSIDFVSPSSGTYFTKIEDNSAQGIGSYQLMLLPYQTTPTPNPHQPQEEEPAPSVPICLDHLWKWDANHWITSSSIQIDPNQPTYILTHGWNSDFIEAGDPALASTINALSAYKPDANILGWDWADPADPNNYDESDMLTPELWEILANAPPWIAFAEFTLVDAFRSGINAGSQGSALGSALAYYLRSGVSLGSEIHMIGHSHGGGLLARAANKMKALGYSPTSLTMLDTPNTGLISSTLYLDLGTYDKAANFYYSFFDCGWGFGGYSFRARTNVHLNSSEGSTPLHSFIHNHWYPPAINGTQIVDFSGTILPSLTEMFAYPEIYGDFEEVSSYSFVESKRNIKQSYKCEREMDHMVEIWDETFESANSWNGNNIKLIEGFPEIISTNSCILMEENVDSALFKNILFPDESLVLTFEYYFLDPRGLETLTVYLNDEIVHFDNSIQSQGLNGFRQSDLIYAGDYRGTWAELIFRFRGDRFPGSGLMIDNIKVFSLEEPYTPPPIPTTTPSPTPLCINNGDVNFDGSLTSNDAQTTFYIVLNLYSPVYEEACAADCNGDDSITAADAQLIFLSILSMGNCTDPI